MRGDLSRATATHGLAARAIAALCQERSGPDPADPGLAGPDRLVSALVSPHPDPDSCLCAMRRDQPSFAAMVDGPLGVAMCRIGTLWDEDAIPFVEAVRVMATLKAAILRNAETLAPEAVPDRESVLLATLPGHSHGLSATLVGLSLREAGHDVMLCTGLAPDAIAARAVESRVGTVGLSVGDQREAPAITNVMEALGALPIPPRLILGGPVVDSVIGALTLRPDGVFRSAQETLRFLYGPMRAG